MPDGVPFRALTVRQPWAWAIARAGKTVENRAGSLGPHTGPLAIHAGVALDEDGLWDPQVLAATSAARNAGALVGPAATAFPRGCVVAVVTVVGGHPSRPGCCSSPWGRLAAGWHYVLAGPCPLPEPVPCRGALGLWTLPEDVAERVTAQLAVAP